MEAVLPLGPETRRILLRSLWIYLFIVAAGYGTAVFSSGNAWHTFGLGIMFPGAGFLAWLSGNAPHLMMHAFLFFASIAGFLLALFLWFATGNVLLPPGVWLGCAIVAALMNHGTVWAGALSVTSSLALLAPAILVAIYLVRLALGARTQRRLAAELSAETIRLDASRHAERAPSELPLEQIQMLRTLLDRALQPLDRFDGFNHLDQFQTAALRYQLNAAGYALSMYQYQHVPAFDGYLYQAQRNLVLKNLQHCVWQYWERENRWGNFDRNPDPCGRDNIMFTGFLAAQIALCHSATGRKPFAEKGVLAFRHPSGREFRHDTTTLAESLFNNVSNAPLGLVPCEPNWAYPLCNTIAAAGLKYLQPRVWARYEERFAHSLLSEFCDPAGHFVPCKSIYTGFSLPGIGGAVAQAFPCFFLNATRTDIAERHWLHIRGGMLKQGKLATRHFWPIDVGNYGFSRASSYAACAAAAVELGDHELAGALFAALDHELPASLNDGVRFRANASFWAHSIELLARCGRRNALRDLISGKAQNAASLPKLVGLNYPEVLVASAHSTPESLDATLYPGSAPGLVHISIANLRPAQRYRLRGALQDVVKADARGGLTFDIALAGRTTIHVAKIS